MFADLEKMWARPSVSHDLSRDGAVGKDDLAEGARAATGESGAP